MNFKDGHKAVFLPVCEKILCQYVGFVLNEEMRNDLKVEDVFYIKKEFSNYEPYGLHTKIIGLIIVLPLLPFIIIGAAIDTYNKNEKYLKIIEKGIFSLFAKI